jgi:hypothetical protein
MNVWQDKRSATHTVTMLVSSIPISLSVRIALPAQA